MMKNLLFENYKILTRISNHLIINASFMSDLGLYHGKMGIVLFFSHYARYTNEVLYNDFAGELLDEIFEEIHSGLPVNMKYGLCGIGWGIMYLLQGGFMNGNADEILEDIDKKIMEYDLLRIEDKSFETGLAGISFYIECRLQKERKNVSFDETYLNNWEKILSEVKVIPKDVFSEILEPV